MKVKYIRIDGSISTEKRYESVNKFQTDDTCKIAILAITACATGLTLTKASTVVFAEMHFTPAVMIQAEDRAHRIGQEHNSVNVHYLFGKDTVDETIFPKILEKFLVVSNTIDAKTMNMELHNVKAGNMGEIETKPKLEIIIKGNQPKNSLINNDISKDDRSPNNKNKITDFFSKVINSKNLTEKSNDVKVIKKVNHKVKENDTGSVENINKIILNDSFDDVIEGILENEEIIEFLSNQKNYEEKIDFKNKCGDLNIHQDGTQKRSHNQIDSLEKINSNNRIISFTNYESYPIDEGKQKLKKK